MTNGGRAATSTAHDSATQFYLSAQVELHPTRTARVALRRYGSGAPLVFLHGWPLYSFTFRRLLPYLAPHFTCLLFDVPGGGDSEWGEETDFSWPGQAATIKEVLDVMHFDGYFLFGQDAGAMIARQLALTDAQRVRKLVITNTEIPGHRPPWIPLYRLSMFIPGTNFLLRQLLRSRAFLLSRFGFGNSFYSADNLDQAFHTHVIEPLIKSPEKIAGHNRFLRGWDWKLLDQMADQHANITMPVLMLWGEDDPTFPVDRAEEMVRQFPNAQIRRIPGAKVFVQEDQPEIVSQLVLEFLTDK